MTSEELAREVRAFSEFAARRVMDASGEYTYGDMQHFEFQDPETLAQMIDEELADIICYATMTRIRLRSLIGRFEKARDPRRVDGPYPGPRER